MFKKNIRLNIDVKYIVSQPNTYSGVLLKLDTKNAQQLIIFNKNFITIDMIDVMQYVNTSIGFHNINGSIEYNDNYNSYLKDSKQFKEKIFKKTSFRLPIPKNIYSNKYDIKYLYVLKNLEKTYTNMLTKYD